MSSHPLARLLRARVRVAKKAKLLNQSLFSTEDLKHPLASTQLSGVKEIYIAGGGGAGRGAEEDHQRHSRRALGQSGRNRQRSIVSGIGRLRLHDRFHADDERRAIHHVLGTTAFASTFLLHSRRRKWTKST